MAWIVVLGEGSWGGKGFTYRAGVHEVEDDRAQEARAFLAQNPKSSQWLIVTEREPTVESDLPAGELTLDDVRLGVTPGVRLPAQPESEPPPEEPPDGAPSLDYPCESCDYKSPSPGDLARHVEFEHSMRHLQEVSEMQAAVEAARQAEAEEQRVREADPGKLPVWERETVDPMEPVEPAEVDSET